MTARTELLARAVADAGAVTVLTGAGVSTASGIPDFRSEDGIWERYDRDQFDIHRFENDPGGFWRDWLAARGEVFPADPDPNPAHESLADLVRAGAVDTLVTQNTDGLHQAAGAPDDDVVELHGSGDRVVCSGAACRYRGPADPARERAEGGERPPACPQCGSALKPDSVLFGESLPEHAHLRAHAAAERSDLFLVVGSSLTVEPAASLPETAADRGATLAVVNLESTPLDGRASYVFQDRAEAVLPELRDHVLGGD
ncbi:MAG: Sir2 family NAD-dependent protein deacetylase [Haloarculaceae archaeon]